MDKFVITAIFINVFLLHGCEPAATFDQPQPNNSKPLISFPKRLQGAYLNADRTSIVSISDKLLTRQYDFDCKEHKDSLGSSYKLVRDTLFDQTEGTKEKVVIEGDSIIQHVHWTDTLFDISGDNILTKFKGHYFLNSLYSGDAWEVKKLSLQKGMLTVGNISDKGDIEKLKEITETTADTTSTRFVLTRRQFIKFVAQESFNERDTFRRMKTNLK